MSPFKSDGTLKSTPTGKSPGPDGYTISYYKKFRKVLVPHFTSYANSIAGSEGFRSESLIAHISVIPKPGKDLSDYRNFHPISLLNVDIKLYAKVLATRLLPLFPHG